MTDDDVEYDVDVREHPEEYEVGQGSEGAFTVQPYKGELVSLWTVSDLEAAEEAAPAIYGRFESYLDDEEREPERWYDREERKIALVYGEYWNRAREHERYRELKEDHRERRE